jgi:glutamine---fructose-6-phosphate transaminase (isomerizing)
MLTSIVPRRAEDTLMYQEAGDAAPTVARQLAATRAVVATVAQRLRKTPPRLVVTCARGSSDHAATYAKYLIETQTGVPTASAAPSLSSLYAVTPHLKDALYLVISQSGRSPDLLASADAARAAGAIVVALVNDLSSPLVERAHHTIPLSAGVERSVAATKSYVASLAAIAHLVAQWTEDASLQAAVERLPDDLAAAFACDGEVAVDTLKDAEHLYVIGRGVGLAAAQEIALKCKETSALHAEAFSAAEVRHGPYALLGPRCPALVLVQDDASRPGTEALADELLARGVPVLLSGAARAGARNLPGPSVAPRVAPCVQVVSAYRWLAQLAVARGMDPDRPPSLRKITETV